MSRHTRPPAWIVTLFVLAALAAVAVACRPVGPAGERQSAPLPTPADDWQRIAADGRLVVGVAGGYPPFEYYNDAFQLDGYDVALVREIAKELGLDVTFKDIAFDGLPDALALGQIDLVAAALTVTPERAALLDFSAPYFASTEGYLMRPGAEKINAAGDLQDLRIGVEKGSIYEQWLAQAGLDPNKLQRYSSSEAAVADIAEDRIDVLVTDLPNAQALARRHGLAVAGRGLFSQQYALAMRAGSTELRDRVNAALAAITQRGVPVRLAKEYLGLEPEQVALPGLLPSFETAALRPTAPPCRLGMAWVADLSLPDNNMTAPPVFVPGQPFTKHWRIQNVGTCPWDSGTQLVFTAFGSPEGSRMGGEPVALHDPVEPGATIDLAIDLVAPLTAGLYQGVWELQGTSGRSFGERLRVGIQVAGAPTPTPQPTQTPAPGISFFASAERVQQGTPISFTWDVQNAAAVYFYISGQEWADRQVKAQDSAADIPAVTTTYNLRVERSDGTVETRELTVYVDPLPDLPQIENFTLAPAAELPLGQCVQIAWQVAAEAELVTLFRNKATLWETAPLGGTLEDCPDTAGSYEYAIGAKGAGGINYAVATLNVVAAPAAAVPAVQPGPVIDIFAVLPTAIEVNGCVASRWTVGGDVAQVRILRGDTVLFDAAPLSGNGSDCLTSAGVYTYTLEASSEAGVQDRRSVTVTVGAAIPTPGPTPAPTLVAAPAAAAPQGLADEVLDQELVLIAYRGPSGAMTPPLAGTRITLRLGTDNTLTGNGGCNTYRAAYTFANGELRIETPAVTEQFCAEPLGVMDQELQYLSALQTAASATIDAGQLTLSDGAGNPVAVYVTAGG